MHQTVSQAKLYLFILY